MKIPCVGDIACDKCLQLTPTTLATKKLDEMKGGTSESEPQPHSQEGDTTVAVADFEITWLC